MATKARLEVPAAMQRLCRQFELNDVNAFDYFTELLRHAAELKQNPFPRI